MKELQVCKELWNDLSEDDKNQIENLLKREGLLESDYKIVAEHDVESNGVMRSNSVGKQLCKAGCEVTFQSAKVAALGLTNPVAVAAAIVAAEEARKICRDRC